MADPDLVKEVWYISKPYLYIYVNISIQYAYCVSISCIGILHVSMWFLEIPLSIIQVMSWTNLDFSLFWFFDSLVPGSWCLQNHHCFYGGYSAQWRDSSFGARRCDLGRGGDLYHWHLHRRALRDRGGGDLCWLRVEAVGHHRCPPDPHHRAMLHRTDHGVRV